MKIGVHKQFQVLFQSKNKIILSSVFLQQEICLYGRTHSDDEDEGEDEKVLYHSANMVPCATNQLSSASRARRKEVVSRLWFFLGLSLIHI